VDAPLPLDLETLLSKEVRTRFEAGKTTGTVEKTGGSRTIMGLACEEYQVRYWTPRGDEKTGMRDIKVWAAGHDKVDLSLHDELLDWMRMIFNRDEKLRKELLKISGIQMRLEMAASRNGKTIKYIEEVTDIVEKDAPAGIYTAPEGYKKTETLGRQDLPF
jgi:hypothetical protein